MKTTKPKAAAAARIGTALGRRKRAELLDLLRPCFARTEPWVQAGKYAAAVMSDLRRRNGWTIAERAGDRTPDRTQRLLNRAVWDAFAAMGCVRRFAVAGLDEAARKAGRRRGLAVSPATVALDRENISDSLLILLLVLAADAVSGAIAGLAARDAGQDATLAADDPDRPSSGGALGRLILAGLWVGLAFQAKEIEAWMVLPALGLAYLLSGPGSVLRRAGQLAAAGVVVALVSVSWMTAVSLVPAADRPYVDGSHDNSVFTQVFAYNGFERFGDQTPLQVRANQLDPGAALPVPPRAAGRLLDGSLGRDTGWLIPAAAVVAVWGIASRRRQPRSDPLRACFILWEAGW